MRIGIDLQCLPTKARELTGISNYAYLLSKYLLRLDTPRKFVFFLPEESSYTQEFQGRGAEIIFLPRKIFPFWTHHVTYVRIIQKAKLDILHGPANTLPLFYEGRSVLTIHDLAIYKHPEWFSGGQWFSTKYLVPRSIEQADKIIVPSEATKRDLMELFHVSGFRVNVIPHGVEERFFRSDERLATSDSEETNRSASGGPIANRYILFVGTLEPRKNLVRLVQAYASLPQDILDRYDLVIAGQKGWKYREAFQAISNLRSAIRNRIKMPGYVSDEELPSLMQNASLFVYPSLYEGFGLPVLEAMAAGVPVVTSHQVARNIEYRISNIGRNSTFHISHSSQKARFIISVNPYSVSEISQAIQTLIRDNALASQISAAGIQRAGQFTWANTAAETLQVYLA